MGWFPDSTLVVNAPGAIEAPSPFAFQWNNAVIVGREEEPIVVRFFAGYG